MKNFIKERVWIRKKIESGVNPNDLKNCVGIFSDKKKKDVMNKKNLSSKQYENRYNFLSNVYYLLDNEKF